MDGFARIGRLTDLQERRPSSHALGGLEVVVVKIADSVYAFENSCPHQHFSLLHQGAVQDCTIACPMHGWTFDLESGKSRNGSGSLRKRAVKVVGGDVWVQAEEQRQSYSLFDGK